MKTMTFKSIYILCAAIVLMSCDEGDEAFDPNDDSNEEPSVEVSTTGFTVDIEENPEAALLLGTVTTTTDNGSTVSYAIDNETVAGAVSLASDGKIHVLDPTLFDYEKNPIITVQVAVSSGEVTDMAEVTVNLIDEVLEDDNGLVAYLPLDGDVKDASGNGNHGTNYGAAFGKDRKNNTDGAAVFNQLDENAITLPTLANSASFSVSLWFKDNGEATDTYRYLIAKTNANQEINYALRLNRVGDAGHENGALYAFMNNNSSNGKGSTTQPIPSDKWVHVAITYDHTANETAGMGLLTVYENGVSVGTHSKVELTPENGLISIGAQGVPQEDEGEGGVEIVKGASRVSSRPDFWSPFGGSIDDVAYFDQALSAVEVKALSEM
ncbi:LamG domain-containing protein [Reichenbachiella carrageenanivorans]|uniref:LamG domain-containing protein n=1 Tax=Reichenbachiella carrageenanivorans TaxID=2979869 RepID=A0ABY6D1A5_9BACT|nr:LamG domain-containing protein [Reichenbachiella carrageenanivorans]UXX79947.1 LamG domain-containing protein [Reichenbachiella carrageenanivorans]